MLPFQISPQKGYLNVTLKNVTYIISNFKKIIFLNAAFRNIFIFNITFINNIFRISPLNIPCKYHIQNDAVLQATLKMSLLMLNFQISFKMSPFVNFINFNYCGQTRRLVSHAIIPNSAYTQIAYAQIFIKSYLERTLRKLYFHFLSH